MVATAAGTSGRSSRARSRVSRRRPSANACGVVLYADASQPSPHLATRRNPAGDPQLATQTGTGPGGAATSAPANRSAQPAGTGPPPTRPRRTARDSSKRRHRSSKGTPASAWSVADEPAPTPATTRPGARAPRVASTAASWTGPRSDGSATVVARSIPPARSATAASSVGPSSQGRWKARWSLAQTAARPRSRAASTTSRTRRTSTRSPLAATCGRCTPTSIRRASHSGFPPGVSDR